MESGTDPDVMAIMEHDSLSGFVEGSHMAEKTSRWELFVFTSPFFG